jgi:hypothetical protein
MMGIAMIHPTRIHDLMSAWRVTALWFLFALALSPIVPAAEPPTPAPIPSRAEAEDFFEKSVRPILAERCLSCHGGPAKTAKRKGKIRGGLDLSSRAKILEGGDSGPAIVPGNVEDSLLVRAIRYHDEPRMPPDRRLGDAEIRSLSRWIEQGAPWPGTDDARPDAAALGAGLPTPPKPPAVRDPAAGRSHWSFRPVIDPAVPEVEDRAWPASPVDRFVLSKLESHGLKPAPPAGRQTLIRRASFDLTGLPPTPEAVEAFVRDPSPDAFARVVDRLLDSPHYGERWGRHWLDLVRYADTAGETADYPIPEARHYRDYVVDAFNADLPYDRFIQEQVAGDLIAADRSNPDRARASIVATGFLAIARRFGFDSENYHHLTIDDTIDALGKSILGLTIACARCHDHKFDPIPAADYYALYGIFASTRYAFPGSEEKKRPRDFVTIPAIGSNRADLVYAVAESEHPADAKIQRRGDPTNLGPVVRRGMPGVLGGYDLPPIRSGSGRRELAAWLTDPANPLTYRVVVNRLWQHHFGRGIVATASNFGIKGALPSHPELLDWLASRFIDDGFSIKAMHRRILLSATYQQRGSPTGVSDPQEPRGSDTPVGPEARRGSPDPAETDDRGSPSGEKNVDPDNIWLSHFNRRRLDAESIRDAILFVSGDLDKSRGGAHPFPPVEQWGFTQHKPFLAVYPTDRRSIYLMTQRIRRHPFLALFDGSDPNASTEARGATTVPTQSLFFLNDPLVHRAADDLAGRLIAASPDPARRIDLAFRLALGRPPSASEVEQAREHLDQCRADLVEDGEPAATVDHLAWASFARILFGTNEFIYVD